MKWLLIARPVMNLVWWAIFVLLRVTGNMSTEMFAIAMFLVFVESSHVLLDVKGSDGDKKR